MMEPCLSRIVFKPDLKIVFALMAILASQIKALNLQPSLQTPYTQFWNRTFCMLPICFIEPFLTCHLETICSHSSEISIGLDQFITVVFINFPNVFVQCIAERSTCSLIRTGISFNFMQNIRYSGRWILSINCGQFRIRVGVIISCNISRGSGYNPLIEKQIQCQAIVPQPAFLFDWSFS